MSQTGGGRSWSLGGRRDHTRTGEIVMGQLIDEIITLLALGDTRHPNE
jgi:hypothetical protein